MASGMVGLGDLPGGTFESEALGGSADGSIIVGTGNTAIGQEAFIWDWTDGMRNLKDVLTSEHGVDLTGWTLGGALAMSANGDAIVGWGLNPAGQQEAWLAQVVPEPSSAILASIAGLGLVVFGAGRIHARSRPSTVRPSRHRRAAFKPDGRFSTPQLSMTSAPILRNLGDGRLSAILVASVGDADPALERLEALRLGASPSSWTELLGGLQMMEPR